jgi:catechol 2,3-dioxygenase-like lactoylglutathione lyase family enzyme
MLIGARDSQPAQVPIPSATPRVGGVAVAHIGVCVADLSVTLDFYRALGFRCSQPKDMGTAFSRLAELDGVQLRSATAELDGYLLWLLEWGGPRDPGVPVRLPLNRSGQLIHFGTHCDDFDAVLDLITVHGGTVVERTRGIFPPAGLTAPGIDEPQGGSSYSTPTGSRSRSSDPAAKPSEFSTNRGSSSLLLSRPVLR